MKPPWSLSALSLVVSPTVAPPCLNKGNLLLLRSSFLFCLARTVPYSQWFLNMLSKCSCFIQLILFLNFYLVGGWEGGRRLDSCFLCSLTLSLKHTLKQSLGSKLVPISYDSWAPYLPAPRPTLSIKWLPYTQWLYLLVSGPCPTILSLSFAFGKTLAKE